MNKSHLLINEPALQILPSLAQIIGLDEAIVIQQLHYWLNNPKAEGRIDENGEKWVYNTYAEWKENNFPFWSEDKIQRIFLSLEKQGVVISAQLDAKKRDMRKFYRIAYDQLCTMDDSFLRPSNTPKMHDVKRNAETTTETTQDPFFEVLTKPNHNELKEQEATHAFENAFGFWSLPWHSKTVWTKMAKFVTSIFENDRLAFGNYVVWRDGEGKYKAMSNTKIRLNPEVFMDTGWPDFEQSKPEPEKPRAPTPQPDYSDAIPNPGRKPLIPRGIG